jgi:hypothetical protein
VPNPKLSIREPALDPFPNDGRKPGLFMRTIFVKSGSSSFFRLAARQNLFLGPLISPFYDAFNNPVM